MKSVAPRHRGFTLLEVVVAVACAALLLAGAYAAIGGTLRNSDKAAQVMNASLVAASVSDAIAAGAVAADQRSTSDARSAQQWSATPTPAASDSTTTLRQLEIRVAAAARVDRALVTTSLLTRGVPAP
jgi:prepilin-type N-terminal cleavage/methylation domain-containing protein